MAYQVPRNTPYQLQHAEGVSETYVTCSMCSTSMLESQWVMHEQWHRSLNDEMQKVANGDQADIMYLRQTISVLQGIVEEQGRVIKQLQEQKAQSPRIPRKKRGTVPVSLEQEPNAALEDVSDCQLCTLRRKLNGEFNVCGCEKKVLTTCTHCGRPTEYVCQEHTDKGAWNQ